MPSSPPTPFAPSPSAPGWCEIPVRATPEDLIDDLLSLDHLGWMFRGESQHYTSAIPSLGRLVERDMTRALDVERRSLFRFRQAAFAVADSRELAMMRTIYGTQVLMQHHGGPTRLLDWSASPWVAAFWAVADCDESQTGRIWAFDPAAVRTASPSAWRQQAGRATALGDIDEYIRHLASCGEFFEAPGVGECTPRMLAQQTCFTIAHPVWTDHVEAIGHLAPAGKALLLQIPGPSKKWLIQRLASMNVSATTLLPGLDGVGTSVRHAIECGMPLAAMDDLALSAPFGTSVPPDPSAAASPRSSPSASA